MQHYADTIEQKLRKVLAKPSFCDRKSSTVLHQMSDLAGAGNDGVVKLHFQEILPREIEVGLAALPDLDLKQRFDLADRMMEQVPSNCSVARSEKMQNAPGSKVEQLESQIEATSL